MEEKKFLPQIKEIDKTVFWQQFGNHSRIELKNSAFGIGKLNIGIQKFNDDNKQTAYVNAYIDLDKALAMSDDILSGRFSRKVEANSTNPDEMVMVYKVPGGQPADKANRPDKKPLYREFSISKGKMWILSIQEGPGKVTPTGGFMPDGKPDLKVNIGLSNEGIKAMAKMLEAEYTAYRTSQYLKLVINEIN